MLVNHINSVHIKFPAFPCEFCDKGYFSLRKLKEHHKQHHSHKNETNTTEDGQEIPNMFDDILFGHEIMSYQDHQDYFANDDLLQGFLGQESLNKRQLDEEQENRSSPKKQKFSKS